MCLMCEIGVQQQLNLELQLMHTSHLYLCVYTHKVMLIDVLL